MKPSTTTLVGSHVGRVIERLQRDHVPTATRARPTAQAAAQVATLRHATLTDPVADIKAWQVTLAGIPPELLDAQRDQPSAAENAVHAALVLWARHQQSRSLPMHVEGRSVGRAVQDLSRAMSSEESIEPAVMRRFHSVATATSRQQRLYHLNSLISLLRAHEIPLDYVQLARDLFLLETARADQVVWRWGRELYRRTAESPANGADPASDSSPANPADAHA